MKRLQHGDRNPSIDARTQTLPRQVLKCYHEMCLKKIVEPTFEEMKGIPAVKAFLSHLESEPIMRMTKTTYGDISRNEVVSCPSITEMPPSFNELTQQKAIVILDQERRTLGAVRWIRGEGDPFFINSFAKAEPVKEVLASIPVSPPPTPKPRPMGYGVHISKTGGEFRIADNGSPTENRKLLESTVEAFRTVAPGMSLSAVSERFSALKAMSDFNDFVRIAKRKCAKVSCELAGRIENGRLVEAAVYVMAGSDQPIAASRFVREQGMMFFQNLLKDDPKPVDTVLKEAAASIEMARSSVAQAQK